MKTILFTHEIDIDGLGCAILARLSFSNPKIILCANPNTLTDSVKKYYDSKKLYDYDVIYITDLSLLNPMLDTIAHDEVLSKKIQIFDHHKSAIDLGLNKYSFTHIQVMDGDRMNSGTKLFYDYLVSKKLIKSTNSLDEFVELTRLEDTWEWRNDPINGTKAWDLAVFLGILGKEEYINIIIKKLIDNPTCFDFSQDEQKIIDETKERYARKIKEIWESKEYLVDDDGNKFAIVLCSSEYTGGLVEYVRSIEKDIKYFIVIDLDNLPLSKKSYRNVDESFDVSKVAIAHGGAGHKGASGVPISLEQKQEALKLLSENKIEGLKYLVNSKYSV